EFLVVLRYATHTIAYQHAVQAFEAVEMLNKLSKKSYPMSVSYGVLEDRGKNKETSEDILREIDEHMYAFKNQQKKARK
ncbi:MAG: GGDEF domain-containing protein, partial [Bacteroidaceae bacterium]